MWPFDQNSQQMYQQYSNAWDQGSYGQLPEQEVRQNYQQFVQNAPPQMVEQAHQQYYEQMPPQQHGSFSLSSEALQQEVVEDDGIGISCLMGGKDEGKLSLCFFFG